MRKLLAALILTAAGAPSTGGAPSLSTAPLVSEPAADGQILSPFDVHMVAGPFVGAPGESHVCSDWEVRAVPSETVVWTAPCAAGTQKVHIHLGDGEFVGFLAGRHQLNSGSDYRLRVRFQGDANGEWSDWAERLFRTTEATAIPGLILSDVASIAAPRWRDEAGSDVSLPAGQPAPALRLEVAGGVVLEWTGGEPLPVNPPALSVHGPLRVVLESGDAPLSLPASRVTFTDGSGQDREVFLPSVALEAGQTAAWWIAQNGGAFTDPTGGAPAAEADFSSPASAPPVPWAVQQPGFRIERVATDFQLPVNIAFVPNPEPGPDAPSFYVTELYGTIKVVTLAGQVRDYATNLLNFSPTGAFPGSGEKGLTGIAVEPESGDVFASMVYAIPPQTDVHFPKVVRFHSGDGGLTASSQTTILDFPTAPSGASHQISNLSIGPDGKLYVHVGDGFLIELAQDLESVLGKILRVDLTGAAPPDNPFYNAGDGLSAADLVFASGLRNPFGGTWRAADGAHWEVENGPGMDRLAKVVAGRNYGWDGSNASMTTFAAYNWPFSFAPVNIAFVQPSTFGGSGFPAEKMDHAFVTESGPTYALGPPLIGKRISEFVLDLDGNYVSGPVPLIVYAGAGRATATALAAGPDGLYFADLYRDFGASSPIDRGASVFRVRWAGIADFVSVASTGDVPLTVEFRDSSGVPSPSSWHWEFGDGESSDEQNPVHTYLLAGVYDVRLTVTGSGGPAVRQKPGFVRVGASPRVLGPGPPLPRPTPRLVVR